MDADVVVIGAGVVGLAIAAELASPDRTLYVLEKNDKFGQETSSRNSEVIHAGLYYKPGSLKAKLCIEGNRLLYAKCEKWGIPHEKVGKLIVANKEEEIARLDRVLSNAKDSGVSEIRFLSSKEIREMEPHIVAGEALFSQSTGIIDSHNLMRQFLIETGERGGQVVYRSYVTEVEKLPEGYRLKVAHSCNNCFDFTARILVNAAGHDAHNIAGMLGHSHKIYFCKGSYFSVGNGKERFVNHLIYPPPEIAGLGIHSTLDLSHKMRLGPDVEYQESSRDYAVSEGKKEMFFESARKFLSFLEITDLAPDFSGIRPKLQGPGEGFRDFSIFFDPPGAVHLIGIESPGLTASPAIAGYVAALLKKEAAL